MRLAYYKHYDAGYLAALADILAIIQDGVSASGAVAAGSGVTVARVMDWIDTRRDAIRARVEEQDEEDRENRSKQAPPPQAARPRSVARELGGRERRPRVRAR